MIEAIIHDSDPITLIGGADFEESEFRAAQALAPGVVAADGGAMAALKMGAIPRAVIGDFDSIDATARATIPSDRLHPVADQDTTDFDKCLERIKAPLILGVGFTGTRIDHELAAFGGLLRFAHQRCILIGSETIVFLSPPVLSLDLTRGSPFSLFPMGEVTGRSAGLRWPIEGLDFAPWGRIGTSNEVSGPVTLEIDAPRMLVLLPRQALAQACAGLLEVPATWPVP